MLEFIVLGQIPGTNIYLSFKWVAMIIVIAIIVGGITTMKFSLRNEVKKFHIQQALILAKTI